jgi:hypothetical protein
MFVPLYDDNKLKKVKQRQLVSNSCPRAEGGVYSKLYP